MTGATVSGAVSGSQVFITDRTVTIGDLYVSDHEVTQAEYEAYCKYGNDDMKPTEDFGAGDDYPAYFVSWYDAIVYCNLRSMDEGLEPVYQLNGETDPANWTDIVSETTDGVTKYCGPSSSNSTWDSITMVGSSADTVTTAGVVQRERRRQDARGKDKNRQRTGYLRHERQCMGMVLGLVRLRFRQHRRHRLGFWQ